MKAIILSAGKGTRMKEVNEDIPKVLLPILDKPMILWNIELLKSHGIEDIAINTHHLSNKIKDYLGNGEKLGVNIKYSYEDELLGTSGALNNFKNYLKEPFVVLYGDVISLLDLQKLIDFHTKKGAAASLVIHDTDHPEDSDIVQVDENAKVINLIHKPGDDSFGILGNAALYVVEPTIFNYLPEGKSDFIKDVFSDMLKKGEPIYGYNTKEFVKDAGTPERIEKVENYLKKIYS